MGGSRWSDDFYTAKAADKAAKGLSAFAYSDDVKAKAHTDPSAVKVSTTLDPTKMRLDPKTGKKIRESRDSATHPDSLAIVVMFDVTGSMHVVPVTLQKKLPALMNLLIKKGYVEHPQILFGAIGDATCDRVPLQVGQFESGIEMDDNLGEIYLEGGGGGHNTESYELAAYFVARHTEIDCFEKRGQKGFCFFIGDELPYEKVNKGYVDKFLGGDLKQSVSTEEIFAELKNRYEVFCIIPGGTSHFKDSEIKLGWQKLLGQNVIMLEDADNVSETIAMSIGLGLGKIDLEDGVDDLKDVGVSAKTAKDVGTALAPYAAGGGLAKKAVNVSGTAIAEMDDDGKGAKRL